ncbi:tRNA threonylcarbamoyl adenosine modification protein YeaZ [Haloechinothrix alba]|uniref:tRNA threonylcarbamoyl adenosine modification protein YeaZ n=1 Tax=Haloechinothrix alba TaxID=664784 RepID=A0A238VSF8_9PSEU|nr:tRNA (adenosine(37)-N6)-threonylcarbamoyltransferase complex dimerization subunit type 1 TsaB [Haloechinothrix alba]SNR37272.1 tRNA threonylcarbamoyl adenosine modification protein YeaZ [Haloechinothrix alba]
MLVLALDTSTPAVTAGVVALGSDIDVLASRVTVDARAHGELITLHLQEAVAVAGITLRDVHAVVCGAGPGPYTGLRAGMVSAAALAHGLDVPAYPVCSLDATAAEVDSPAPFLVVSDARRREVYWARYGTDGLRVSGPRVDAPSEVDVAGIPYAAGDGARLYEDRLGDGAVRPIEPRYPSVRGLVACAADALRSGAAPDALTPLYLRKPHAKQPGERKRVSA